MRPDAARAAAQASAGVRAADVRVARVVAGGQTGVDRAVLSFAVAHGVAYGGWVPAGGWAEDCPDPPGVLAEFAALVPLASAEPRVRTSLNVRDADALVVVMPASTQGPDPAAPPPGTVWARLTAEALGRPWCQVDPSAPDAVAVVTAFLDSVGSGLVLNVAGPRASECPSAFAETTAWLSAAAPALFGPAGGEAR